ncbi:MAG: DNA repair protein RecO [Ostreibacterium sp.]
MHIEKDSGYLLHTIPYRENSALAHILTASQGSMSFIVNGINIKNSKTRANKSNKQALLQPCRHLRISYQMKDNLSKLTHIEATSNNAIPDICHFMLYQYAHELLLTLLPKQVPLSPIFQAYQQFLALLCANLPHVALRTIELALINYFDSLPNISYAQDSQQAIKTTAHYYLHPELGLFSERPSEKCYSFEGDKLLAFFHLSEKIIQEGFIGDFSKEVQQNYETFAQAAQPISAVFIAKLLNGKRLKTRDVYRDLQHLSLI